MPEITPEAKTLERAATQVRIHGPRARYATPAPVASGGAPWDAVLVRSDGWTMSCTNAELEEAKALWADPDRAHFIGVITKGEPEKAGGSRTKVSGLMPLNVQPITPPKRTRRSA